MTQYDEFISEVERLKEIKNDFDNLNLKLKESDQLVFQHLNAWTKKMREYMLVRIENKVG